MKMRGSKWKTYILAVLSKSDTCVLRCSLQLYNLLMKFGVFLYSVTLVKFLQTNKKGLYFNVFKKDFI